MDYNKIDVIGPMPVPAAQAGDVRNMRHLGFRAMGSGIDNIGLRIKTYSIDGNHMAAPADALTHSIEAYFSDL